MSHVGAFLWTLSSLSVGASVVIARTFDAHEILPLLRPSTAHGPGDDPGGASALIRDHDASAADFASLRICRAGADKVSLELEREFAELVRFPIDEGYGMTEVGIATLNPPSGPSTGSIGRPVRGFRISIRDETGVECRRGRSAACGSGRGARPSGTGRTRCHRRGHS